MRRVDNPDIGIACLVLATLSVWILVAFLGGCHPKVAVEAPHGWGTGYSWVQTEDGRIAIKAKTDVDARRAVEELGLGPAAVERWELLVVEPLTKRPGGDHGKTPERPVGRGNEAAPTEVSH